MKTLLRIAIWALISSAIVFVAVLLFGIFVVAPRIQSKSEAYHSTVMASYRAFLEDVGPEAQFENHTCGLHALRVIYKAYGLNPDDENLRFRLGVDVPSNPADGESTGTLQPDMLRVLVQDGFHYERLPLDDVSAAAKALVDHLNGGNMAAALISRRENGRMHWVAAHKVSDNQIIILDSLVADPYPENPQSFVAECVLSCLLINPTTQQEQFSDMAMWDGSDELLTTVERYQNVRRTRAEQVGDAKRD